MNINEYIQRKEKEIELANLIEVMGIENLVSHISDNTIFFNHNIDIEQTRRTIRPFSGNETLVRYYMNSPQQLSLVYRTPDKLDWAFYISGTEEELQERLDQVSLGKCKIKHETIEGKSTYISCGVS